MSMSLHTDNQFRQQDINVQIRWLIRRDMLEVLEIERANFEFAWSEEEFLCCLRQRNCIGMVAEYNHHVVGFMIYELHKARIQILNFAVKPLAQRMKMGTHMVQRVIDKLSQQRRKEIILEVRETNLPAQLFFKSQGFRAVNVLRNHFQDTTEDAYLMQYRLDWSSERSKLPFNPFAENRVAQYFDI